MTTAQVRRRRGTALVQQHLAPLSFTIVTMVLYALFFLWPGALGLYYSFTSYRGFGKAKLVGFDNYAELFADADFYRALGRTGLYTVLAVPLHVTVPLVIAVLVVSRYTRGAMTARVLFFFPWLISPIIVGIIWRWLFGESFGFVNYVLQLAHLPAQRWQSDGNLSLAVVLFASTWGGTAFTMLLFIAALKNIPRSYYEAAAIDGAGGWQQFWRITLPLLRPTLFMVTLLATIGAMKEFALIQSLNGGGPGSQNVLMVQYIYQTGFEYARIGYASAASMVLMVILMVIALLQMRLDRGDLA
ncbi:MAG: sugar ABC transporter permease [Actinomycetia bacterium]|nr:sugar ABC transporter permease [Actinomycetes bacterium]